MVSVLSRWTWVTSPCPEIYMWVTQQHIQLSYIYMCDVSKSVFVFQSMAELLAENYHNIWAQKKKLELESKGKAQVCVPIHPHHNHPVKLHPTIYNHFIDIWSYQLNVCKPNRTAWLADLRDKKSLIPKIKNNTILQYTWNTWFTDLFFITHYFFFRIIV